MWAQRLWQPTTHKAPHNAVAGKVTRRHRGAREATLLTGCSSVLNDDEDDASRHKPPSDMRSPEKAPPALGVPLKERLDHSMCVADLSQAHNSTGVGGKYEVEWADDDATAWAHSQSPE